MRSYNRFKTDETIECRTAHGTSAVALYNLSCGGCMIEASGETLAKGARVELTLNSQTVLPARVAWRIDGNAGIKFDHPLHPSVVEAMGYDEDEEFDRDDPRDRFGIPLVERLHMAAGRRD